MMLLHEICSILEKTSSEICSNVLLWYKDFILNRRKFFLGTLHITCADLWKWRIPLQWVRATIVLTKSASRTCVCDEYWTGLFCTIPICVNGGTLSRNDQFCECPTGYAGPNCQFDECRRAVPVNFSPDNRTLILVLEATVQNKPAFAQVRAFHFVV